MPTRRSLLLGLSALGLVPAAAAQAQAQDLGDPAGDAPRANLLPLQSAMEQGRFIAYHPTELTIIGGVAAQASDASIEADLIALQPWFDGLITYGARNGTERVPAIAQALGFRAVIQGVWNPFDQEEIGFALDAAYRHPDIVLGLSLGNEVVLSKRGSWAQLSEGLKALRRPAQGLPLSTTEPFHLFLNEEGALGTLAEMDFLLANVHPIFENWFFDAEAENWAEFVSRVSDILARRFEGPLIVKETGVPSGPLESGYSEGMQRDFYRSLEARLPPSRDRAFAYFSAFDLPWAALQTSPISGQSYPHEAHWGFFTAERDAKLVVDEMPPLLPG